MLVHLVDLSAVIEGRVPFKDYVTINRELERHSAELAKKPQIVVANKVDLPFAREALPAFVKAMKRRHVEVLPLSGVTGEGLGAVLDACAKVLYAAPAPSKRRAARVAAPVKKAPPKRRRAR